MWERNVLECLERLGDWDQLATDVSELIGGDLEELWVNESEVRLNKLVISGLISGRIDTWSSFSRLI